LTLNNPKIFDPEQIFSCNEEVIETTIYQSLKTKTDLVEIQQTLNKLEYYDEINSLNNETKTHI
jgi:hypothetical protein